LVIATSLVSSVYRNQRLDSVKMVMNFLAPQNAGNLLNGLNQSVKMVPAQSCHRSRSRLTSTTEIFRRARALYITVIKTHDGTANYWHHGKTYKLTFLPDRIQ
jgi:predicted exporter